MSLPRYAIYFVPPRDSPLARFGAAAIGYDCHAESAAPHLKLDGIDSSLVACATAALRRYGFHATLVAPFEIDLDQEAALVSTLDGFARARSSVPLRRLLPTAIRDFIALVPVEPSALVAELASDAVKTFDPLRKPLSKEDLQRRGGPSLTPRQREYLNRWGYPYVFDEFRFHLTLAGVLPSGVRESYCAALSAVFAPLAAESVTIEAISLVRQNDRNSPFRIVAERPLAGGW